MSARHGPVLDRLELAWEPRKTILQYHKIAPEELDRIAGEYAPSDDNETYHLFDGLWHIFSGYKEAAHLHKVIPDLTDTRERLSAMLAACRKLRAHLRATPTVIGARLLYEPEAHGDCFDDVSFRLEERADRELRSLASDLSLIERNLNTLLTNSEELRILRGDSLLSPSSKKSIERRKIWEPSFRLWLRCGKRKLPTARGGRAFEVLCALHTALSLPLPNEESVYSALRDFKRALVG